MATPEDRPVVGVASGDEEEEGGDDLLFPAEGRDGKANG